MNRPRRLYVAALPLMLSILAAHPARSSEDAPEPSPKLPATGVGQGLKAFRNMKGTWTFPRKEKKAPLDADAVKRLQALGYLDGVEKAPEIAGVTVHDRKRASPGFNLYASGHDQEANLTDMDGKVLHRWRFDIGPELKKFGLPEASAYRWFFRRVALYPNGDLLALYDNLALVRLDKDSNLKWIFPGQTHHAFVTDEVGDIHVLAIQQRVLPWLHPKRRLFDDQVVVLDADDGSVKARHSILGGLAKGGQDEILAKVRADMASFMSRLGDVLHTNHVELVDERLVARLPDLERGSYLLSSRRVDAIMVLNPTTGSVDWLHRGRFLGQHHPTVLDDGTILMFDNQRDPKIGSRLLEIDPATGKEGWQYRGSEGEEFYSQCCGTVYRLPNGNTLASETGAGRAIEVTPDGEVVWEFVSPHRAGKDRELISQLFDMVRLPPDFPIDWTSPPE